MIKLIKRQLGSNNQSGQIMIILLLLLLVLLATGLAITQRSTTDLTVSTQTEQASRAFSAAEAGIDQAITTTNPFPLTLNESLLNNQSRATVRKVGDLPLAGMAMEYPIKDLADRGLDTFDKENFAQFWLANPNNLSLGACAASPPAATADRNCGYPSNTSFEIYYGDINTDPNSPTMPAVEIKLIDRDLLGAYTAVPFYYDSVPTGVRNNGFNRVVGPGNGCAGYSFPTDLSQTALTNRSFLCRITITPTNGHKPILVRLRMLYHSGHPLAIRPTGNNSLPPQGEILTSTGFAGQSQKRIQLFREFFVAPPFFDFAIFSSGDITK